MKRFIAFMAAVVVAVSCCFPVLAVDELPDGVTVIDQEPEELLLLDDFVPSEPEPYELQPGESWLCEEHQVLYMEEYPDNICYTCWLASQPAGPAEYSGEPLMLFSDSAVAAAADTTIADNAINLVGVSGYYSNSWVGMSYNTTTKVYTGTLSNLYYKFAGSQASYPNHIGFGIQQVKNFSANDYTWFVFGVKYNGSSRRVPFDSVLFRLGNSYLLPVDVIHGGMVPRTVTAQGDDGFMYHAIQLWGGQTGSYLSVWFNQASTYGSNVNIELKNMQLYLETGDDSGPPAGWYPGDPNYNPGGGEVDPPIPDPPTDIEIISGKFDEIFAWLENIRDNLTNGFTGLSENIADGFSSLSSTVSSVVSSAKNAIVSGLSSVESAVSTGFTNLQSYLESVFSNPSNDEVSGTAGEIADTINQQEEIENGMYEQFDSSVAEFNSSDYSLPADVGGSIGFILTCFTGLFDGLGSYKAVFLFVPAFSISLAFIGRMAQVTPGAYRSASRHQVFSNHSEHVRK